MKRYGKKTDDPSIIIYVNKIENKTTFRIKTWCYLQLLMPETMKLLGNTKSKITEDDNSEEVPHLKITEVTLVYYNIVSNDNQHNSRGSYKFVANK